MGLENQSAIDIERERRLVVFHPIFQMLVSLVSFQVTYTQDYNQWSMKDLSNFKRTIFYVGEMLMNVASVLGGDNMLQPLSNNFFQDTNNARNRGTWD